MIPNDSQDKKSKLIFTDLQWDNFSSQQKLGVRNVFGAFFKPVDTIRTDF